MRGLQSLQFAVSVSFSSSPTGSGDRVWARGRCGRVLELAPSGLRERFGLSIPCSATSDGEPEISHGRGFTPQKSAGAPNPASPSFRVCVCVRGSGWLFHLHNHTPGLGGWVVACLTSPGRPASPALVCCHYRCSGLSPAWHEADCTLSLSSAGVNYTEGGRLG